METRNVARAVCLVALLTVACESSPPAQTRVFVPESLGATTDEGSKACERLGGRVVPSIGSPVRCAEGERLGGYIPGGFEGSGCCIPATAEAKERQQRPHSK